MMALGLWQISKARIKIFAIFVTITIINLLIYNYQLVITNSYYGYKNFSIDINYFSTVLIFLIAITFILPKKISLPSDFFAVLYSLFSFLSFLVFAASPQKISFSVHIVFLCVMFTPLIFMKIFSYFSIHIRNMFPINNKIIYFLIWTIVVSSVVIAIFYSPPSAGFRIDNVHLRRLASREIFVGGAPLSYLLSISMSGLIPFIAFNYGRKSKLIGLAFCLILDLGFFYSMGVKSIFLYTCMAFAVGFGVRQKKLNLLYTFILISVCSLFVIFCIEWALSGYSLVAEYFFRRVFIIPGYVVVAYIDVIFANANAPWTLINGANIPEGPSYYVGRNFFGNAATNATTNAFISSLASGGILGYFVIIFLVTGFFKLLDILYVSSRNSSYLFIGFLYALLITEQNATTAFISSGPGLLLFLSFLSGRERN